MVELLMSCAIALVCSVRAALDVHISEMTVAVCIPQDVCEREVL